MINLEKIAEKRTISLTGRRPVIISDNEWPVVAVGEHRDWDNQYEFQANREWDDSIYVRQHADGRAVVYGVSSYITRFRNERGYIYKAGKLLSADDDISAAIYCVAKKLSALGAPNEVMVRIAEECIGGLEPEEI